MKNIPFSLLVLFIVACKKSTVVPNPLPQLPPNMQYKDLGDSSIRFGKSASYDLNNDGEKDILFSTQLVGDPIEQKDKRQWLITSSFNTNLPVNNAEQTPAMYYNEQILLTSFAGNNWYNASQVKLSQKTITMSLPPYWEGNWTDASHRYIAFQIKKQDRLYNGWVEVSFSTANERLIIHRAAVSTEADRHISAGL